MRGDSINRKIEILKILLDMNVLISGAFKLVDGTLSDYFIDTSKLFTNKRALDLAGDIIFDQFQNNEIETIVSGYSLSTTILGNILSERFGANFIPIKDLKIHQKFQNKKVLILLDVLVTSEFASKILQELHVSGATCELIGTSINK